MARIITGRAPTIITPMLGPATDGRIRVAVTSYTDASSRREFSGTTSDLARHLRNALPGDRFDIVSDEMTGKAARLRPHRTSVGWGLRTDYVVSGMIRTIADVRAGSGVAFLVARHRADDRHPPTDAKAASETNISPATHMR